MIITLNNGEAIDISKIRYISEPFGTGQDRRYVVCLDEGDLVVIYDKRSFLGFIETPQYPRKLLRNHWLAYNRYKT
jgi:hypothetical protein